MNYSYLVGGSLLLITNIVTTIAMRNARSTFLLCLVFKQYLSFGSFRLVLEIFVVLNIN